MSASTIRIVGGLLPADVMAGVLAGSVDGLTSNDYHLGGEQPKAAAARVWTHLLGVYRRYRDDLAKLPDGDAAVGVTRERWLSILLTELGYGRVSTTPAGGLVVEGKAYPVSHVWGATPLHLLGWGVDLDKRTPGLAGAAQRAPHAMVQELLNRTDDYLWAILSNGRALRLLRDSTTLTGQAYVEFDLESMFDAEVFADFVALYLLSHQSRVEVPDGGQPAQCWLERWRTTAVSQGVRALSLLRDGVQQALETLGTGFLQHPANHQLRDDLAHGTVRLHDVHQSLLRVIYRLLFWAVAEDRDALLDPASSPETRERYLAHFSSTRLRRLAVRRHGSAHDDLWQAVTLVMDGLARTEGETRLGVPGLGGLFSTTDADVLVGCRLGNRPLLAAVRSLSVVQPKGQPRRHVDFQNLGAEELGSIYESLLELVPRYDPTTHAFTLELLAGNDRKTSGSYYTPTDLVELVLDTALDPVLDEAEKSEDPEASLLALKVCDPAIGSGHFMVAAARRIATRVATVRTGEIDPTPTTISDAMHDVVARCIYGVDLNPMAADLAKVSLWLEAMTPGKPLSFLDHHVKVGNALLGTTPALLYAGIPDEAFVALTGDNKSTVNAWKKLNTKQRSGQTSIFDEGGVDVSNVGMRKATEEVADRSADAQTLADVAWAAQRYAIEAQSEHAIHARRTADAWCGAFLSPKTPDAVPITHEVLAQVSAGTANPDVTAAIDSLATRHRLFHWHLEFPEVFQVPDHEPANSPTGWVGGFSAMLGNPPWETLQMSEKEFFATRAPDIAEASNAAARKKAIAALADTNPQLYAEFLVESRRGEAENHLIRGGRFPLCARGKINTYSIFAEHFRACLGPTGRTGIITPTGLGTDATTAPFFADTLVSQRLAAFYDFDNEAKVFEAVHHSFRFAVSSMTGGAPAHEVQLAFVVRQIADLQASKFVLTADEILLLNPNTGTLPVFRSRRDAEITLRCYQKHPVLVRDGAADGNPWGLRFSQGLFNMASDSGEFRTADDLEGLGATFDGWAWECGDDRWLPLYEAKMLSSWNHRFSTYAGATEAQLRMQTLPRPSDKELDDPNLESVAKYWVAAKTVQDAVPHGWARDWFFGWRDIARASDIRTFVPSVMPLAGAGDHFLLAFPARPSDAALLQCVWSSLVFDFVSRQKVSGTHMKYFTTKQLACPPPTAFGAVPPWAVVPLDDFVCPRVLELDFTSHRILPYAVDAVGREAGAPYRWIPERREQIKAELDAAMLHLYSLARSDAEHILDSFPVVRKNEERDLGEFRTKRLVLAAYDAMTDATSTGVPFVSPLDPPPGHGPRHPEKAS
jgi:hypothetical protein